MPSLDTNTKWEGMLLDSLDMGIVIVDLSYQILNINRFIENHANTHLSDVKHKSLFEVFPEVEKEWFSNKCKPIVELKTPMFILWEQRPRLLDFESARPITSLVEKMYQNVTVYPIEGDDQSVQGLCVLIQDVTDQAVRQQQLDNANKQLAITSRTDGLTQLYNRAYWQERFEREYKLAHRDKTTPHSLMMLDIDFFKKVNDTYGHQGGDEAIKALANIIRQTMRTTDLLGRYGGEEFAILLPNTDVDNASIVAERLRLACENHITEYDGIQIKFTISIGISQFKSDYTSPQQWIEDADQALYKAKNEGRNRVCLA